MKERKTTDTEAEEEAFWVIDEDASEVEKEEENSVGLGERCECMGECWVVCENIGKIAEIGFVLIDLVDIA